MEKRNLVSIATFVHVWAVCFIIICVCCACAMCNRIFNLPDDNVMEELLEEAIQLETGVKIDLTPSSSEKL